MADQIDFQPDVQPDTPQIDFQPEAQPVEQPAPQGYVGRGEFAPSAGAESVPLTSRETPEEQAAQQGPLASVAKGVLGAIGGIVPTSLEQANQMVTLPRPSQFETKDLPESQQLGEAWRGEHGVEAQAGAITGTALQALPLTGILFGESPLRPSAADLGLVDQMRAASLRETLFPTKTDPLVPLTESVVNPVGAETPPTVAETLPTGTGEVPTQVISGEYQQGTAFSPLGDSIRRRVNTLVDGPLNQSTLGHPEKGLAAKVSADPVYARDFALEQAVKYPDEAAKYNKIASYIEKNWPIVSQQETAKATVGTVSETRESAPTSDALGSTPSAVKPPPVPEAEGATTAATLPIQQGEITNAIEPSNAQVEAGKTQIGVGGEGTIPAAGSSDNVVREAQGAAEPGTIPGAEARQGTQTGTQEAANVAKPEIPPDATAKVNFKTDTGETVTREMNAREAEGIFTKERSSFKALLDCLGK